MKRRRNKKKKERKQFVGKLDGLTFLPLQDIEEDIAFMENTADKGLEELMKIISIQSMYSYVHNHVKTLEEILLILS